MKSTIERFVIRIAIVFWALFSVVENVFAEDYVLSPSAKLSVLTCSPGPDLYSLFGHTAIRLQDTTRGQIIDLVYNYGTFIFDDDFYMKFAQGKLDYLLSREAFGEFQREYIEYGRGIFEQELLLTQEEKQNLFNILEENLLPENRVYRYDFFYDNCATRVRDMIVRATSGKPQPDGLGFTFVDTKILQEQSRINFSYVYAGDHSFRDAIQNYLQYQPWSDFGIDLALGMPCDRIVGKWQYMFLPDSLMTDFDKAIYQDKTLTAPIVEILPQEYALSDDSFLTPMNVMIFFLIIHAILVLVMNKTKFNISGRVLFFVSGLLGCLVVFLWFFTDHTATKTNLNILWANPVNLIIALLPIKFFGTKMMMWLKVYALLMIATLMFWVVLPQKLNPAVLPLILSLLLSIAMIVSPKFLGFKKQSL